MSQAVLAVLLAAISIYSGAVSAWNERKQGVPSVTSLLGTLAFATGVAAIVEGTAAIWQTR